MPWRLIPFRQGQITELFDGHWSFLHIDLLIDTLFAAYNLFDWCWYSDFQSVQIVADFSRHIFGWRNNLKFKRTHIEPENKPTEKFIDRLWIDSLLWQHRPNALPLIPCTRYIWRNLKILPMLGERPLSVEPVNSFSVTLFRTVCSVNRKFWDTLMGVVFVAVLELMLVFNLIQITSIDSMHLNYSLASQTNWESDTHTIIFEEFNHRK